MHSWVNFKYEQLLLFCHYCGLLGHDIKHCASYYAASKNDGEVDCLKAARLHAGSPIKQGSSCSVPSTKNRGPNNSHDSAGDELQSSVAQEVVSANPKGVDGYINGMHASMETTPNSQGVNAMHEGRNMSVIDKWGTNHGEINSGTLNSNVESKEVSTPAGHVTNNVQIGPVKPTAKWTRVPRMDCGLEMGGEAHSLSTLGKKGATQMVGEEDTIKNEKQGVKYGKFQDDNSTNSTVGVLDHPCRSQ